MTIILLYDEYVIVTIIIYRYIVRICTSVRIIIRVCERINRVLKCILCYLFFIVKVPIRIHRSVSVNNCHYNIDRNKKKTKMKKNQCFQCDIKNKKK